MCLYKNNMSLVVFVTFKIQFYRFIHKTKWKSDYVYGIAFYSCSTLNLITGRIT